MCGQPQPPGEFANDFFRQIFAGAAFLRLEQKPLFIDREPEPSLGAEIFNILGLCLVNLADRKHGYLFGRYT